MRLALFSSAGCIGTILAYNYSSPPFHESSAYRMLSHKAPQEKKPAKTCIVVGAGLEGTTTAYFLMKRGWKVTVVDAGNAPAEKTSFANAVSPFSLGHRTSMHFKFHACTNVKLHLKGNRHRFWKYLLIAFSGISMPNLCFTASRVFAFIAGNAILAFSWQTAH